MSIEKLRKFLAVAGLEDPVAASSLFKEIPKLEDDFLQSMIKADSKPFPVDHFQDLMRESGEMASEAARGSGISSDVLTQIADRREKQALAEMIGRSDFVKLRNKYYSPERDKIQKEIREASKESMKKGKKRG